MQGKRDRDDKVETAVPEPQWEEPEQKEEKFVNPHTKVDVKEVDFSKPGAIKEKEVEVPDYHVVEAGDNIYRIAERYHVFEEDILKWNKDLNPLSMKLGQKIYLSEKAAKDAGEDVSPDPEIKPEPIPSDEDMEKIKKEIVVDGPVYHIVVKGDTVYNICKRFNVTQEQLKEWNNLSDITIKIGQKLQVSE
jgi:LysM repeat protein